MARAEQPPALHDNGFYNIGVRPAIEDIGIGGLDPYGNPLSFARQFIMAPGAADVGIDRFPVDPCELNAGTCASLPTAAQALFAARRGWVNCSRSPVSEMSR